MLNPPLSNVSGNRYAWDRFTQKYRPPRDRAPTAATSHAPCPLPPSSFWERGRPARSFFLRCGRDARAPGGGAVQDLRNPQFDRTVASIRAGVYASALGLAETSACHFAMLVCSGGTESFAGFMKSMATRAVISASNVLRRRMGRFQVGVREWAGTRSPEACWPPPRMRPGGL